MREIQPQPLRCKLQGEWRKLQGEWRKLQGEWRKLQD
jgi:hypothetical protein